MSELQLVFDRCEKGLTTAIEKLSASPGRASCRHAGQGEGRGPKGGRSTTVVEPLRPVRAKSPAQPPEGKQGNPNWPRPVVQEKQGHSGAPPDLNRDNR